MKQNKLRTLYEKDMTKKIFASLLSILIGLVVGSVIIAAVGFSMGAFRAWQAAALSDAVTASVAVNWMATAEGLMVPGNNQLRGGSAWQMLHPGILHYLDYPDVASLAAPKPMLIYAGEKDTLFPLDSVNAAFGKMSKVFGK